MLTGILIISVVIFIAVVSYRRPRLEQRVIKQIPVIDWLIMFVFPILCYIGLVLVIRSILLRQRVTMLDFDDIQLIGVGGIFMIYLFVGTSVHFVSKVLSRYINKTKDAKIYQINELFHGKLSHYIVYVCGFMVAFLLAILEINYPMPEKLPNLTVVLITALGMTAGFSSFKSIFYTNASFGGYNKPFFLISIVLLSILSSIYRTQKLPIAFYPMNIFISGSLFSLISIFIIRQFLIFSKLSKKNRMRFIARLFSTS